MALSDLILKSGDWQARLVPGAGGLIAGLTHAGTPILRTMPDGSVSPLDAACFPMVPWCNRIADGRFTWAGEAVDLARNFPPEPHAIHGHGWQAAWHVKDAAPDSCTMGYHHAAQGSGWPWAYAAEQRVVLSPAGCSIKLSVTNHAATPMPAGLGLHPYLRRRAESRVRFAANAMADVGTDMIPTGQTLATDHFSDFAQCDGAALPRAVIDHCFAGWDGSAVISDDLGTITVTAQGTPHLHLYAPEQDTILCLEPVNHLPDAINREPAGMAVLAPGETTSIELRISATP